MLERVVGWANLRGRNGAVPSVENEREKSQVLLAGYGFTESLIDCTWDESKGKGKYGSLEGKTCFGWEFRDPTIGL